MKRFLDLTTILAARHTTTARAYRVVIDSLRRHPGPIGNPWKKRRHKMYAKLKKEVREI